MRAATLAEAPLWSEGKGYFAQPVCQSAKCLQKRLAFPAPLPAFSEMGLPSQPVTLSIEQLDELNKKLSIMRHDINNHLSLIMAAVELLRHKPQLAERMMA